MNAEMIIDTIRDSIENYEVFKELALDIRFRKADMRLYAWSKNVLGISVYLFRFADNINEYNIVETITQCRLMRMADNEEWKDDFWDISMDDRMFILNEPNFQRDDLIIKEVILSPLDAEECLNTVGGLMNIYSPVEDTSVDIKDTICDIIRKSQHINLGNDSIMGHMWLSVSDDTILIIEHGIYD